MKNWFALYVQPRKEKIVEKELLKRGYEVYLPLRKVLRQWKDRKKLVETPLIPSYIFTNIEEKDIWEIVKINGCVKFVWFNGKACPIPEYQINSIKLLLEKEIEIDIQSQTTPKLGDMVRIIDGGFAGLVGRVKHKKAKNNFTVSIDSLGIDLTITLDKSLLQLVEKVNDNNKQNN
ncbi:MAG: UpxY family transcription antiterminator [Bacteroidales bacterium]|jgi:transcription antitermination factor NusG|nr:UpxY family transcription antiterminator [Bacteroidales bacterium]MDD4703178.1 UpxY family transcription antiterminator [Bacteroidales bacterium]MDX9797825.1 UpxY family transcription antiterminator [Bacteroidales bacterium]